MCEHCRANGDERGEQRHRVLRGTPKPEQPIEAFGVRLVLRKHRGRWRYTIEPAAPPPSDLRPEA